MEKVDFKNAYYIKLGEGGKYEQELKNGDKVRAGWFDVSLEDLQSENWQKVEEVIKRVYGGKRGATQDFNALKNFCTATENDVFITFAHGLMYWGIPTGKVKEDLESRFRVLKENDTTREYWNCRNIFGDPLYMNRLSGRVTKTAGYRGTLCAFGNDEVEILKRMINGERDPTLIGIEDDTDNIKIEKLRNLIKHLHWKDCEILMDLIYRERGWRRISMLGGTLKDVDFELLDPKSKERYQVQVKAEAGIKHYNEYVESFNNVTKDYFKKRIFAVFTPSKELSEYKDMDNNVELLTDKEICQMIVDHNLLDWVLDKIG